MQFLLRLSAELCLNLFVIKSTSSLAKTVRKYEKKGRKYCNSSTFFEVLFFRTVTLDLISIINKLHYNKILTLLHNDCYLTTFE